MQTLLILGGNPAYNAPVDLDFGGKLAKAPTTIRLSLFRDETSRLCGWHIPQAHFLEAWGDAYDACLGTESLAQPLIEPLHGGKSAIELLALVLGTEAASSESLVRQTFGGTDEAWRQALHDGGKNGSFAVVNWPTGPAFTAPQPPEIPTPTIANGQLEIIFCPDAKVYDGRFANNGWLQELPDPMTRLTWDNAAMMSPATAEKLGVRSQDVVRLKYQGREIEAPVYVMQGQADGTVALPLGYGRTAAGKVGGSTADGVPPVGFNAYLLRTSKAMDFDTGLTVEPTGRTHELATVQDHFAIDTVGLRERIKRVPELVREVTAGQNPLTPGPSPTRGEGRDGPGPSPEKGEGKNEALWQEPTWTGPRWGMTIDLARCIGCGACVVACQAENNIPIVGRERVLRGRQMQWLRIDRYFRGPRAVFQPVACQQCELAPCEAVCPVAATTARRRGAQRHGLQPLHRHPLLLEQLPLQGAALQLLQLSQGHGRPGQRRAEDGLQPGGDGPQPGGDGEVQLLHPADQARRDRGQECPQGSERRRNQDRLPAGLPDAGDHFRRPVRQTERGRPLGGRPAQLYHPRRVEHQAADVVFARIRNPNSELHE